MSDIDKQYLYNLQNILENGTIKKDRTGTGTISLFGTTIRHKMSEGFPLLTTRKAFTKNLIHELIWFLKGDTNIKYLIENGVNIWLGDAYKKYCTFYQFSSNPISYKDYNPRNGPWDIENFRRLIKEDPWFSSSHGELGPIYGKQWRKWSNPTLNMHSYIEGKPRTGTFEEKYIDQIQNLLDDLRKNPDSRRLMVTAWNPAEVAFATLPPCHYGFQCWTSELTLEERIQWVMENTDVELENLAITERAYDESTPKRKISLSFNMRSVDYPLGLYTNIPSYALLLSLIAHEVNMVPDELIGFLGDSHIYLNQIDGVKEQLMNDPYEYNLPKLWLNPDIKNVLDFKFEDIRINNYKSYPSIKFPLSN